MASSFNKSHWPSMYRSKHAAAEPWQTQPDISSPPASVLSAAGGSAGRCLIKHSSSLSGYSGGGEQRSSDPKPRWNPRPEQIRILEAIFNSGMINPPRDEIPRIRMRLQEYGQVGDANVFYWFQNRKSRSKNKLRAATGTGGGRLGLLGLARAPPALVRGSPPVTTTPPAPPPPPQPLFQNQFHQLLAGSPAQQQQQQAPTSSSSSSSDRSSGSSKPAAKKPPLAMSAAAAAQPMDLLGPLAAACPPQMYYQGHPVAPPPPPPHKVLEQDLVASDEPICFQPWPQAGYCLSAADLAATILGGQYMHAPAVQQQPPPALPAGAFLGLCNEVAAPEPTTVTGHRTCAWAPAAGLEQLWPGGGGGADHRHHQLGKNDDDSTAARAVAYEDATKMGLLQYAFGASTAMETASAAAPPLTAASPASAAVTVASVAATTPGLANYDLLQGLAVPGAGAVIGVSTGGASPPAVATATAPTAAAAQEEDAVAALCITDTVTGKSVAHSVAAARLDVKAQFGDAAVLLRAVGGERGLDVEPVPVDASGCTVEPLQHGAFYYVLV